MSSDSSIEWKIQSISANGFAEIAFGDNTFVAVASAGNDNRSAYSVNGIDWAQPSTNKIAGNVAWSSVAYGDNTNTFVAVGAYSQQLTQVNVSVSTNNGATWTAKNTDAVRFTQNGVAFGNGVFISVGNSGSIMKSTDNGNTWTSKTPTVSTAHLNFVVYHNSRFVAVGASGTVLISTDNGENWSKQSTAVIMGTTLIMSVASNGTNLVAVGASGKIFVSTNHGETWVLKSVGNITSTYNSVVSNEGSTFVAVSSGTITGTPKIVISTNSGTDWSQMETPIAINCTLNSVAFGKGYFVAVASNNNLDSTTNNSRAVVGKFRSTLTNFNDITKEFGDVAFELNDPTSNSTGGFTYTSSNNSVGSINNKTVTIVGAGETTITATQAESSVYSSKSITAKLTVNKANPVLGSFSIPIKTFGDPAFQLTDPTSNSTGEFSYQSLHPNVATVSGKLISIVGAGVATIDAHQNGTNNYNVGSSSTTLTVNKAIPFLSNFNDKTKTFGDQPFQIHNPTTNSNGNFYFTSSHPSVLTISGDTATITGVGTITITAILESTPNFQSSSITAIITINKAVPSLSNFFIPSRKYNDGTPVFTIPPPQSNSDGLFTYISSNELVASIINDEITVEAPGVALITAIQQETQHYLEGQISTILTVANPDPIILLEGSDIDDVFTKVMGEFPFSVKDKIISDNTETNILLTYEVTDDSVTIIGDLITINKAGTFKIIASQPESPSFSAITKTFTVVILENSPDNPANITNLEEFLYFSRLQGPKFYKISETQLQDILEERPKINIIN
jgi:photosystem II stability/assembly factor-like uncharacterized protein